MQPGKDYIGVGCGALIVNDKGETLLLKRKHGTDAGRWSKPGGTVEFGETIQDAIKREVREEVGVEIDLQEPLGFTNHIDIQDGRILHWVALHYLAHITSGAPQNLEPENHEEIRWFPLDKLPENITQTTREPVEMYLKRKNL